MPTSPAPQLPRNTNPVGTKTKRVNFQDGNKTELEIFQRNVTDRMDEVLNFLNNSFQTNAASKATGQAAVQSGSSQSATNTKSGNVAFKGQPTKMFICPLMQGFSAAGALGSTTVFMQDYKPAGSTVTPTLDSAKCAPALAGSVIGFDINYYLTVPTAGSYTVNLYNVTQNNRVVALAPSALYSRTGYITLATPVPFNAGDSLRIQLVTAGWTQGAGGGMELRLWAQT